MIKGVVLSYRNQKLIISRLGGQGQSRRLNMDAVKEGLTIKNIQHPEWGNWKVLRKYDNGIWEIRGESGVRVLMEDELNFWEDGKSDALKESLSGFTGTFDYFKHPSGLLYTDGVKYMAEEAGAYWLIDIVASYQHRLRRVEFQIWTLTVNQDKSAVVTAKEDTDAPLLIKQKLEYTDFSMDNIKLYYRDGVLMLPSEY